jgi:mannose-6-phosphate isomerase-like protein (cupin superfamily)
MGNIARGPLLGGDIIPTDRREAQFASRHACLRLIGSRVQSLLCFFADVGTCPAVRIRMRSIIVVGLLLIAPPTFGQQSSTAGRAEPQTFSIVSLVERELIPASEPRRETLLACSGNTRTTLVQLNQDQPQRLYDTAEVNYYVVAGEGTVRMAGRDTGLAAGSLVALPRGTAHGMVHRGKRPLILLVTLSGAPCEQTR